jgi:hypothetical protein
MDNDKLEKTNNQIATIENKTELETLKNVARGDFKLTRENVLKLIEDGMTTLDEVKEFANQTNDMRWYRIYTELMRTVSENNRALIDMTASYKNIVVGKESTADLDEVEQITNNNTLIIGSTVELQKMLEEKLKSVNNVINSGNLDEIDVAEVVD